MKSQICPHCGNELQPSVAYEELKEKPFLSISETCKLIGISRRTVYRMLERGELIAGKAGKRTILRRSDLDKLFDQAPRIAEKKKPAPLPLQTGRNSNLPDSGTSIMEISSHRTQPVINNQLNLFED